MSALVCPDSGEACTARTCLASGTCGIDAYEDIPVPDPCDIDRALDAYERSLGWD